MKIYHNPRCRKSRETLQLIEGAGKTPEIVEYLNTPPTASELNKVLEMLDMAPQDIIRKQEAEFKEFKGQEFSRDEWIDILVSHPKLIERPIVVSNGKAVIGRPPENVQELL